MEIPKNKVDSTTLNNAIQKASGDNKSKFTMAIMHSQVATNLENLKLLKYMTQTDGNGVERELTLASWNGRAVLIDDSVPTVEVPAVEESGTAGTEGYVPFRKLTQNIRHLFLVMVHLTMKILVQRFLTKCIEIQKQMVVKILCI